MPFARQLLSLVRPQHDEETVRVYFVEHEPHADAVHGTAVISNDEFLALECAEKRFSVAIADSRARERIADACEAHGVVPLTLRAPSAISYDGCQMAEGAILCAGSVVGADVRIGRHFQANVYSYVAHDCVIGNYVTFGPGVLCNGCVHVEDHAYIGAGAILRNGTRDRPLRIGHGAFIGMGAVVTKDVRPFTTVIGNPARPLVKRAGTPRLGTA